MERRNLTVMGLVMLIVTMLLVMVYAPAPPASFAGTVTVNGSPKEGAVVYAYIVDGGETLCGSSDPTTMTGGSTWFIALGCDEGINENITLKVKPNAGDPECDTQYDISNPLNGTGSTQIVHLFAYIGGAVEPGGCELGAACTGCVNWRMKEGPGIHGKCTSPGNEGCVTNSLELDGPLYHWACCSGTITKISTY